MSGENYLEFIILTLRCITKPFCIIVTTLLERLFNHILKNEKKVRCFSLKCFEVEFWLMDSDDVS